jgi:hypothetical protein
MPELSLFSGVLSALSAGADSPLPPKLLYSRRDAAHAISVSIRALDILIANGQIATRKIGSRVLITAETLTRYASEDHACLTSSDTVQ